MEIPPALDTDAEDVAWALQTAASLWKRNERADAIVWLRRAAQAAGDAMDDDRALALARQAAELSDWLAQNPAIVRDPNITSIPPQEGGVDDLLRVSSPEIPISISGIDLPAVEEPDEPPTLVGARAVAPVAAPVPPPVAPPVAAPHAVAVLDEDEPTQEVNVAAFRDAVPSASEAPPAAEVHKGMLDPWSAAPPLPRPDARVPSAPDSDEGVVTSAPRMPSTPMFDERPSKASTLEVPALIPPAAKPEPPPVPVAKPEPPPVPVAKPEPPPVPVKPPEPKPPSEPSMHVAPAVRPPSEPSMPIAPAVKPPSEPSMPVAAAASPAKPKKPPPPVPKKPPPPKKLAARRPKKDEPAPASSDAPPSFVEEGDKLYVADSVALLRATRGSVQPTPPPPAVDASAPIPRAPSAPSAEEVRAVIAEEIAARAAREAEERAAEQAERAAQEAAERAAKEAWDRETAALAAKKADAARAAKDAEERAAKEAREAEERAAKEAKEAEARAAKEADERAAKEAKEAEERAAKEAEARAAKDAEERAAREAEERAAAEKAAKEEDLAAREAAREAAVKEAAERAAAEAAERAAKEAAEKAARALVEKEAAVAAAKAKQGKLDLDAVAALADLPDDARAELAAQATVHEIRKDEEIGSFALALVVAGDVDVAAQIVDAPAERLGAGTVLRARGTLAEGVPLRLVCASKDATVATWDAEHVEPAFKACPWVEDDLRAQADRVQALVGVTLGPLADRLDTELRRQVTNRLEVRDLGEGEVILERAHPVKQMLIVGQGTIELLDGEAVKGTAGPGELLFATEILGGGAAPLTARAGKGGAIILFADRAVAQELMVTCPPLLEIFAGM